MKMLSLVDVVAVLSRLRLPRGMVATASEDPYEGLKVRILYRVPDSFDPDRTIDLGIDSYLSPNDRQSEETIQRWVIWRVWRIFGHEAREQVQDETGRPLDDPHAPEKETQQ